MKIKENSKMFFLTLFLISFLTTTTFFLIKIFSHGSFSQVLLTSPSPDIDISIFDNSDFQELDLFTPLETPKEIGRENPFQPYNLKEIEALKATTE